MQWQLFEMNQFVNNNVVIIDDSDDPNSASFDSKKRGQTGINWTKNFQIMVPLNISVIF